MQKVNLKIITVDWNLKQWDKLTDKKTSKIKIGFHITILKNSNVSHHTSSCLFPQPN